MVSAMKNSGMTPGGPDSIGDGSAVDAQTLAIEGFCLGFELFEAGREWDAHEVWEALWKERRGTEAGQLLRGLIQWAAAGVKWRLGRKSGARSLAHKALETWSALPDEMNFEGAVRVDVADERARLAEWHKQTGAPPVPRHSPLSV